MEAERGLGNLLLVVLLTLVLGFLAVPAALVVASLVVVVAAALVAIQGMAVEGVQGLLTLVLVPVLGAEAVAAVGAVTHQHVALVAVVWAF